MINNTGIWVVIPNFNGEDYIAECLKSLQKQTQKADILVVDNGSTDSSADIIERKFPKVHLVKLDKNSGFAGAVNAGIKTALKNKAKYIALFNNDAVAEKDWLEKLKAALDKNLKAGAATGKLLDKDGEKIDNTGDEYSVWGLTIPRDRDLPASVGGRTAKEVFGACGGACMYRARAVEEAGLFDEKFFAYYEDTDMNFRLQLAGWKVAYEPGAIGYHATGSTSSKISGFTTYQTIKNLPMLFWKNVPFGLLPRMLPRFALAYTAILLSSIFKGRILPAVKGILYSFIYIPHVLIQRWKIQKNKKVSNKYIWSILYHDLPPNAQRLRRFRDFFAPGRSR